MEARDRMKLLRAGFKIFRRRPGFPEDGERSSIWEFSKTGSWCLFEKYKTQRDRDEYWKHLTNDEKTIGD